MGHGRAGPDQGSHHGNLVGYQHITGCVKTRSGGLPQLDPIALGIGDPAESTDTLHVLRLCSHVRSLAPNCASIASSSRTRKLSMVCWARDPKYRSRTRTSRTPSARLPDATGRSHRRSGPGSRDTARRREGASPVPVGQRRGDSYNARPSDNRRTRRESAGT